VLNELVDTNATAISARVETANVVDDLTTGGTTVPLSAEQGKVLKGLNDTNATAISARVETANVVDDLTTGGTTVPLSAEQGKVLKGLVDTNVTATQTALDLKQDALTFGILDTNSLIVDQTTAASITDFAKFTANGIEGRSAVELKTDISLENVDNTTDLLKPISTATQTALDLKATIASPTFTGTVTLNEIVDSNSTISQAASGTSIVTVHSISGRVLFASDNISTGTTELVVTNSFVSGQSIILSTIASANTNNLTILSCVATTNTITIKISNINASNSLAINFLVIN
jgi:hypothetical protein